MLSKKFNVTKEDCERFNKANPGYELFVRDGENVLADVFGPGNSRIVGSIRCDITKDGVLTKLFPPGETIGVPTQIARGKAREFVHGLAIAARSLEVEPERDRPWWVPSDDVLRKFESLHGRYAMRWSGMTIHVLRVASDGDNLVGFLRENGGLVVKEPPIWCCSSFGTEEDELVCAEAQEYVALDISRRHAWPMQEPKKRRVFQVSVIENATGEWSAFADCYGEVLEFHDRPTRDMIVESLFKVGYDATYVRIVFYPSEKKRDWIPGGPFLDGFKRKIGDSWYLLERNGDRIDIVQRTENVVGCLNEPGTGYTRPVVPADLLRQVVEYLRSGTPQDRCTNGRGLTG